MIVACIVLADGRDEYHQISGASADRHLPTFDYYIAVDDRHHELGFAGAIREAWRLVLETDATHVFHLEADFTFHRDVPVERMVRVLEEHDYLAQIALVRQPLNALERAAGGLVNLADEMGAVTSIVTADDGAVAWTEHTRCFTTNPCLYPRWIVERGWPDSPDSEGHFGIRLMIERPEVRFAYWGTGEEWVTHIGTERTGKGY